MSQSEKEKFVVNGFFNDFDDFRSSVIKWNIDFLQLDRGKFKADLIQVDLESCNFVHSHINRHIHQRGSPPAGLQTFAILKDPSVPLLWRGKIIPQNGIMAFPPGKELDAVSKAGFDVFTVSFTEELLSNTCSSLGLPEIKDLIKDADVVGANPFHLKRFRWWSSNVCLDLQNMAEENGLPLMIKQLEHDLPRRFLEVLASSQPFNEISPYRLRDKGMKRAEAYLESSIDAPISLSDLCQAAQVSERTLQYAFLERFGVGPKAYMQALRLNRVRRVLRNADPDNTTISDVANRWDFWHMGQFAKDYQKLFGELPSETIRYSNRHEAKGKEAGSLF